MKLFCPVTKIENNMTDFFRAHVKTMPLRGGAARNGFVGTELNVGVGYCRRPLTLKLNLSVHEGLGATT